MVGVEGKGWRKKWIKMGFEMVGLRLSGGRLKREAVAVAVAVAVVVAVAVAAGGW